ncbi:MAG: hypothetical protein P1T08_00675 [Acidimicrobiia bacterium]|nr:hypothetical protein [Acidimicrobiia bacterium]
MRNFDEQPWGISASGVNPGIGVGDHLVAECADALALLTAATAQDGSLVEGFALAGQLLAAELNRAVAAENCAAAEESVVAAQLVLATAEFDGITIPTFDTEAADIVPDLIELLSAYNAGDLCR